MNGDMFSNSLIHIIPFDLGFLFHDDLSIDNSKGYEYINTFISILKDECKDECKNDEFGIKSNIEVNEKIKDYKFTNKKMCSKAFCVCKLDSELECYLLSSGIGVFVLYDFNGNFLSDDKKEKLNNYEMSLSLGYRKVYAQKAILGQQTDGFFEKKNNLMHKFMRYTWGTIQKLPRRYRKKRFIRKMSSNENYKHEGLSYVLSIYLLKKDLVDEKNISHLLFSPTLKNVLDVASWDKIDKELKTEMECPKDYCLEGHEIKEYFSWSAVAILNNKSYKNIDDIKKDDDICNLIKGEIYVQSRWFIGDNTIDNFRADKKMNISRISIVQNILEYISAELESETSANMTSFYKKMVDKIIITSEIKQLYRSSINQIKIQRNLIEARNEENRKNCMLILNIFLSIFTAISFYKSLKELISEEFNALNLRLFVGSIVLAVGIVLFNHFYKRK